MSELKQLTKRLASAIDGLVQRRSRVTTLLVIDDGTRTLGWITALYGNSRVVVLIDEASIVQSGDMIYARPIGESGSEQRWIFQGFAARGERETGEASEALIDLETQTTGTLPETRLPDIARAEPRREEFRWVSGGAITVLTLANLPIYETEHVWHNGQRLNSEEYTLQGVTLTLVGYSLSSGSDVVVATYLYLKP